MSLFETEIWETNIENSTARVAEEYGRDVVASVFARYSAHGLNDLSPVYYSEVFADLEQIANDN